MAEAGVKKVFDTAAGLCSAARCRRAYCRGSGVWVET